MSIFMCKTGPESAVNAFLILALCFVALFIVALVAIAIVAIALVAAKVPATLATPSSWLVTKVTQ
jgi:hypothetical protein